MIRPITTDEADRIIRASWPAHNDIDYSIHTSECGNVGEEEAEQPEVAGLLLLWALLLVAVVASIVVMVAQ